jgi:predicted metalloprotease
MKWEDLGRSNNIEDMRSHNINRAMGGGGSGRFLGIIIQLLLRTTIGRIILIIGIIAYFLGFNPLTLLNNSSTQSLTHEQTTNTQADPNDKSSQFVAAVLGQTEDVWGEMFAKQNKIYQEPKLVLFRGGINSGCGFAQSQVGPFYCPVDQKVYLDLSFFDELSSRHNAPGDFAQAYVIAHEIGHHIQNITDILDKAHNAQNSMSKAKANAVQVNVELQADCYAGLWAHHTQAKRAILEEGDIEEALNAASQIGDDTLQKQRQGYIVPDAFTHGSAADRMKWFKRGYTQGTLASCDTFSQR